MKLVLRGFLQFLDATRRMLALFNCKLVEPRFLRDRGENIFDDSIVSLTLNNSKTISCWDLVLGGGVSEIFQSGMLPFLSPGGSFCNQSRFCEISPVTQS